MDALACKSIFLWNVPAVEGGDPVKIATLLKLGGFESVLVKVVDGTSVFRPSLLGFPKWLRKPNVDRAFVQAMHDQGIAVVGWSFCYGLGDNEGRIAAQQVDALGLDGYVFDVESIFESKPNRVALAGQMIGTYNKTVIKKVPLGLCSWAFYLSPTTGSQYHPMDIAKFLMEFCDYGLPMVYWNRLANKKPREMSELEVMQDLSTSVKQWRNITGKPLTVIGRAYTGDGNTVIPGNVLAFAVARNVEECPGISWWSLEHAIKIPAVWAALISSNGGGNPAPPFEPGPQTVQDVKPAGILKKVCVWPNWSRYNSGDVKPANGGPVTQWWTRPRPNGRIVVGDNRVSLSDAWAPFIKGLQTDPKAWGKIISSDYGPTFGGLKKWLGLVYPGQEETLINVVSVIKTEYSSGDMWALIETLDPNKVPSAALYTRAKTPWLIHEVFGSRKDGKGVTVAPTRCYVPIVGGFQYAPGKWGAWVPVALLK